MEVHLKRNRNNTNFGPTCTKYTLFLLNVVFIIASILTISSARSIISFLTSYYYMLTFVLDTVSLWLTAEIMLLLVASFGVFTAFKGRTSLANIYAVLMMVVFILQIVASILSFSLINQSANPLSWQLKTMLREYSEVYRLEVDWIQSNFQCCGVVGPDDWEDFDRFSTPHYNSYNYNNETGLMPVSCCEKDSNYVHLKCEQYYSSGCFEPVHQIVSTSVTLAGIFGLIFSALQLSGIVLGRYYARIIRRKKTQRDMQIWNTGQESLTSVARQPTDSSLIQWNMVYD